MHLLSAAVSPVQDAPSHGQQSVVHSQGVVHTVGGLNYKGGHSQADQRARYGGELHMAVHTPPRRVDIQGDTGSRKVGI